MPHTNYQNASYVVGDVNTCKLWKHVKTNNVAKTNSSSFENYPEKIPVYLLKN